MPLWEMRLVSITAKWIGWSITNDKGYVCIRLRVSGQPAQQINLPKLRYREEDEEAAITWTRKLYKVWEKANGERTLKDCLKEAKGSSDVLHAKEVVTWADIAAAMKESKIENGRKISPQTWKTNWKPILDEAVRVLGRKNVPADGFELLRAVIKNWKHAPATQRECGRYLARWMEFAVRRFKVPRSWLITKADRDELIPKKKRVRKKAVLDESEIMDFIKIVQKQNPAYANVFRLLTQFGLRPGELAYLSVEPDPADSTGKRNVFYCSYEKTGGVEPTRPRYLRAMYLRNERDEPIQWPLVEAWADGTLELPKSKDGGIRKLSGLSLNTYLHRKNNKGEPSGPIQREWLRLVNKYAEKQVPEWLRVYSFRDTFSVRCHREGLDENSICAALGHGRAVHQRSYRTITDSIVARAFDRSATVIPLE